jgi:hypothetical protein
VAIGSNALDNESKQTEVWEALNLLRMHDRRRMQRVRRHIAVIFIRSQDGHGVYMSPKKICILNHAAVPTEWPSLKRRIAIAGLLVHEATHGLINKLKIPYYGDWVARIERICDTEQIRALRNMERVCETQMFSD